MAHHPAEHSPDSGPSYDVFLSFAGPDREQSRRLYEHMGKAGLRVFLDEYSIEIGESITREIQEGISSSKLFVAYYSRHFTNRHACQVELSSAYIAAQQSGNNERFVVLNPEESTDHIFPKSLTNPEHLIPAASTSDPIASITHALRERALSLSDEIGMVPYDYHPNWKGPRKFWAYNIPRYPKLWDIHTALTDNTEDMIRSGSPSIMVTGHPGVGKTSTVNRYVHYFGAAFSNVYWEQYGQPDGQINYEGINTVDQSGRLNLRILDNIPSDVSLEDLQRQSPPATNTCNIFIGINAQLQNILPTVTIGDLSPDEARAFISHYRKPESSVENEALSHLIDRIGGNASIVHKAALELEDMQGIISYEDIIAQNLPRL